MIAVEWVLVLIAVAVMVGVVAWALGWGRSGRSGPHAPSVKLVRTARTPQGREELLLTVNERVILAADSEGLRLAEYAEHTERMEAVATRLAAALGTPVEFARASARKPGEEAGIPISQVPGAADEEVARIEAHQQASSGAGQGAP
jgi:hypothetical protein